MTNSEKMPPYAHQWLAQRRLGYERMAALRKDELRRMTEADAARIFSQLEPLRPFPLRPSSGLVEQQRLFALIRTQVDRTRRM